MKSDEKKIVIISPKTKTLINFRGDLIKSILEKGYEVVAIGPDRDYEKELEALGVKLIILDLKKDNTNMLGDIKYLFGLKRILKAENPNIVFSYTIKPVIYGSIAGRWCGIKKIYPMITGLGRIYTGDGTKVKLIRLITSFLYKISFKGCSKVIFQNNDDMILFVKNKIISKEKTVKIDGSGVNMKKFIPSNLPKPLVFLMISRIIKEKGVMEYLEAAKAVKEKYPETKFILLGGFDNSIGALNEKDIYPYIKQKVIEFPGETKDVVPYLRECSVFVLPTYYREGIPRTILEAMACAKPVITTDWVGCKEAVSNNENGFLIPIKNSEVLAKKMIYLIENFDIAQKMGKRSIEICKEKFDVDIINKKMLEIMEI